MEEYCFMRILPTGKTGLRVLEASKLLSEDKFEVYQEIERVEDILEFGMPSYKGHKNIAEEYQEAAKDYLDKLRRH